MLAIFLSTCLPSAGGISDGGLNPATDTNKLPTAYRGGSHPASDIFITHYYTGLLEKFPPVRLDAKKHPTNLYIRKIRANALLCLLTHPHFAHLISGLLIQIIPCIAINCMQGIIGLQPHSWKNFLVKNKKSPGRLFLSDNLRYPAYNRVGVESFHFLVMIITGKYV